MSSTRTFADGEGLEGWQTDGSHKFYTALKPIRLKEWPSTHPWAAAGFRTMDGGLRTLDPGHWTSDAGRGRGLRHVAEQPSSGPNWKHQKLGVARGLGWIHMEAENYRITGVPGPTKVLFLGAEPELQWQSLREQMFTPHYICLSRRAD
nr:uncharacterized protein LOC118877914 [Drosophila suzukii]